MGGHRAPPCAPVKGLMWKGSEQLLAWPPGACQVRHLTGQRETNQALVPGDRPDRKQALNYEWKMLSEHSLAPGICGEPRVLAYCRGLT